MAAVALFATDPGLPTNLTAVGLLGFVVWSLFAWVQRGEKANQSRLTKSETDVATLEVKCEALRDEVTEQRKAKHEALNTVAMLRNRQRPVVGAARRCTCGAMAPVLVLFDDP